MRKLRDILRLRFEAGLTFRQIQGATRASVGLIQKLIARAEALGLGWPLPTDLDDAALEALFYPQVEPSKPTRHVQPDCIEIHQQLKQKGVTLQLLWEEYRSQVGNRAYSRSQYCDIYRRCLLYTSDAADES